MKCNFFSILVVLVSTLYHFAPLCEFTFDDVAAVVDNKDVWQTAPLSNLLWDDFWGTPMSMEHSHKSYRPFTTLSFKINNYFFGEEATSFHVVNVVLYLVVCTLFYNFAYQMSMLLSSSEENSNMLSLIAALLFTVHPIHVEAVVGVVGRAELLSAIFYLLTIMFYTKLGLKNKALSIIFVLLGALSKEQAITSAFVCVYLEIIVFKKINLKEVKNMKSVWKFLKEVTVPMLVSCGPLMMACYFYMMWRFYLMQGTLPTFSESDNPASFAPTPHRQLTQNYLLPVNLWLLLSPSNLLCDWSMGTVTLVTSFHDYRNVLTLLFYLLLFLLVLSRGSHSSMTRLSVFILSTSFLPASNLLFPVGFVVAERVLFLPSVGFCMLVACAFVKAHEKVKDSNFKKKIFYLTLVFILMTNSIQTVLKTYDWKSNRTLFKSGLRVTQNNAKLWNNVGHTYELEKDFETALKYYTKACEVQPDDVGSLMNVAACHQNLNHLSAAETHYEKAKSVLLKFIKGKPNKARIDPKHLNVFIALANLIKINSSRLQEADSVLQQVIKMRPSFSDAHINRGEIMLQMGKYKEAIECYQKALKLPDSPKSDVYYNIGIVHRQMGNLSGAFEAYTMSIHHNYNNTQALVNSASILLETGKPSHLDRAETRLKHVMSYEPGNLRAKSMLASVHLASGKEQTCRSMWDEILKVKPDHDTTLYNIALFHYKKENYEDCLISLENLLNFHPFYGKALFLKGDILLNKQNNIQSAQKLYEYMVANDIMLFESSFNLCVCLFKQDDLYEAETCFVDLALKYPQDARIADTSFLVRKEIDKRILLGTLEDRDLKTDVYEKTVYGKQRSSDRSEEEEIYESENSPNRSDDPEEGNPRNEDEERERLMRRAERVHRNFVDIVGNDDHLVGLDAKIEQALAAVHSLAEIDRKLSGENGGKIERGGGKVGGSTESEKARLKSKLLRMLEDLESNL